MYIADAYSGNLFSLNLTPIRHLNFSLIEKKVVRNYPKLASKVTFYLQKISIKSPLTYIGMLLGSPTALSIHPKGYLFYTLSKDCAVVMWDSRTPLTAEWHEIIYQKCSTLTQLLFGQKGSVYAVSKDIISSNGVIDKHCLRIYNHK